MKIKRVLLDPNPLLKASNSDVEESWEDLRPRVRQMFKVMYRTGIGIGLAAPQVGWNVRLFIMNPDTKANKPDEERVFWNPEITWRSAEREQMHESCLSLPGVRGEVMRHPTVHLKAMSPKGEVGEVFEGLAAQIVQHEMGHLNGQLCSDIFI